MQRRKGRDLTQSFDESQYTNINVKTVKWQHKQRLKKFEYRAIVEQLRTISCSNYSHPNGMVKRAPNEPTNHNSHVTNQTSKSNSITVIFKRLCSQNSNVRVYVHRSLTFLLFIIYSPIIAVHKRKVRTISHQR